MKKLLYSAALSSLAFVSSAFADQATVSQLNEILRGELSAVETYHQALQKLGTEPAAQELKTYLSNHREAVRTLTTEVKNAGGVPTTDSGAWGEWAKVVVGAGKLLGDQTALRALKEGEEHGVKEYKEVLDNPNIPASVKTEISKTYLPRQQQHIAGIDRMIERLS